MLGYNEAQDQYVPRSAGETSYVDSNQLFQKLSKGEKIFVEGVKDPIPEFSITYQDNEDMFIKEDSAMFVEHIAVDEFKKKIDTIFRSTELPSQFYSVHDNIRDIILKDLIREDEERMQTKDVWKDHQTYDRSFLFPEVLEHDKYPEEVHVHAAKTIPNIFDKDELTLAQALKQGGGERPLWQEAIRKELTSLIIDNEVFEPIEYKDVPIEMKYDIQLVDIAQT